MGRQKCRLHSVSFISHTPHATHLHDAKASEPEFCHTVLSVKSCRRESSTHSIVSLAGSLPHGPSDSLESQSPRLIPILIQMAWDCDTMAQTVSRYKLFHVCHLHAGSLFKAHHTWEISVNVTIFFSNHHSIVFDRVLR